MCLITYVAPLLVPLDLTCLTLGASPHGAWQSSQRPLWYTAYLTGTSSGATYVIRHIPQ